MVRIEIWQHKGTTSSPSDDDPEEPVKSIPLFEHLVPRATVTKPKVEKKEQTESDSDSVDYDHFFESDVSEPSQEPIKADTAYEQDWQRLQSLRAENMISRTTCYDAQNIPRLWDSVFYISSMQNLENSEQRFFYCIKVKHKDDQAYKSNGMGNVTMYTPQFTLKPGESKTLQTPMFIWKKKSLHLAYGQLKNYVVEFELWKTHRMRINTLYGVQQLSFKEIIERPSNFSVTLNLYIPESAVEKNGSSRTRNGSDAPHTSVTEGTERRIAVHNVKVFLLLEEVFDFFFLFENWWFTMSPEMPENLKELPKTLRISIPTATGSSPYTRRTEPSVDSYWSQPGVFRFRGTLRQLRYACFSISVYCVQKGKLVRRQPILLGTCVMSLNSIQEHPLIRGIVKKLTLGTRNMFSGTVQGNIRSCVKSCTINFFEDIKARPSQPISGSALITQLDHRCQYLVIRVIKCDNLPASNTDSNTSDPMVKVKWDGIINCTGVLESTVSPVYNQNMYFPIHLVDSRELTDPAFIKYSLPADLSSKGPVVVEAWANDESSSDFLGSVEIPLSKIYTHGVLQQRSLVDGIYTETSDEVQFVEEQIDEEAVAYTGDDASNAPHRKHITRIYSDSLTLTGATVPHRGKKSTVSLEMYIIPPMPNDLYIPEDQVNNARTDIYRDIGRRWNKDFEVWQRGYSEKYPGAISRRRFPCVTRCNTTIKENIPSDVIPLCYFIKPVQVYIQLSSPGELMHWISNFTFKDDTMSTIGNYVNIDSWQMPSRFTLTRKGGLQDRAILLCCCLLGLGYDAYVCKGTIKGGKQEHCWVMTRHREGIVTFWETSNKRMWHLPYRWNMAEVPPLENTERVIEDTGNYAHIPNRQYHSERRATHKGGNQGNKRLMNYEIYGKEYISDVRVDLETIIKSNDMLKNDVSHSMANHFLSSSAIDSSKKQNERSPTSPKLYLLIPGQTLVFLPYSSIEVVFNHKQLYGNIQYHHPGCISYDLHDTEAWKPFLKVPLNNYIIPDVQITAPLSDAVCASTAKDIKNDIVEMIELLHAQNGSVATFSRDQQMDEQLASYIDILEFRQRLDPQFDPGMPPHLFGWSSKLKRSVSRKRASKETHSADIEELQDTGESDRHNEQGVVAGEECIAETAKPGGMNITETEKDIYTTDGYDSDATTASTDDNLEFDTQVAPFQDEAGEESIIPQRNVGQRHLIREKRWRDKLRAMVWRVPCHRYAPRDGVCTRESPQPSKGTSNGKLSVDSNTLNIPSATTIRSKGGTSKGQSKTSLHMIGDKQVNSERSEHSSNPVNETRAGYKVGQERSRSKMLYRRSVVKSGTNGDTPSADHKIIINKKVDRSRSSPLKIRDRKKLNMTVGFFSKWMGKMHPNCFPDPHGVPSFMQDVQNVLKEKDFITYGVENSYPVPYEFNVHRSREISKWNWYYNMEARQYAWRTHLPIPPNHTFVATPIHFCTSDMNAIRHILTSNSKFKKLLVTDVEKCIYVIYVKVFPLLGGVVSTWVFLGCHVPWNT